MIQRCGWCKDNPLYIAYHDHEWGVPLYNEQKLFEMLILEGMQAGLNWLTVLKKRENFRQAFDQFNPEKIANYSSKKITQLLSNPGIIRNKLKIQATVRNAQAFLEIKNAGKSFTDYIWQFTEGKPLQNAWKNAKKIPATTKQSDLMSKDLKQRGFVFVGSTICYAFMQATGMVNDHLVSCFRYREVKFFNTNSS